MMPTPRFLLTVEAVDSSINAIGGTSTDFSTFAVVEMLAP
jgi:hypothetical protein